MNANVNMREHKIPVSFQPLSLFLVDHDFA